ncbi:hypothetical protein T439DRAFT_323343 [Meredithblackwellia eburnea MCA 4105]
MNSKYLPLKQSPATTHSIRNPRSRLYLSIPLFLILLLVSLAIKPLLNKQQDYFPQKGLKLELWKHLNQIHTKRVTINPTQRVYLTQPSMNDTVPWLNEDLFPKSPIKQNKNSWSFRKKPEPSDPTTTTTTVVHTLDVLPRVVVVPTHAPEPAKLVFGIVTTIERARVMSHLWDRWLDPPPPSSSHQSGKEEGKPSCLVLFSPFESDEDVKQLEDEWKVRGVRCAVRKGKYPRYETRVLSLVVEFREYAEEIGKSFDWYIFNDDDTFWLDLSTLRRMLAGYDPTSDHFLGASTDNVLQLQRHGRMAFGGAGMLVSNSLGVKMHALGDECVEKFQHVFGGDEMVTRCAALAMGKTKETVTTEQKGLHQFDIPGDGTGLFQSGIPFLNLHHYLGGSWIHLFGYSHYLTEFDQILLIKKVVSFLGGDNLFKRYVFGGGKWLLVQGYSVTLFEEPLEKDMLRKMEHTWYKEHTLIDFPERPMIEERHDWDGKKVKQTFYIDDIKILSPKKALFTYVMADKWDENIPSEERVRFEVLWDECWETGAMGDGCEGLELGS